MKLKYKIKELQKIKNKINSYRKDYRTACHVNEIQGRIEKIIERLKELKKRLKELSLEKKPRKENG